MHRVLLTGQGVAPTLAELAELLLGAEPPVGIVAWDGSVAGPVDGPRLVLRSRRALRRLLWNPGELGLARAYVAGDLDVAGDLTEGLRRCWALADSGTLSRPKPTTATVLAAARAALALGVVGPRPRRPAEEVRTTGRPHSKNRDRQVIAHHYDLGNDFYTAVLDPSMAYSCAWFTSDDQSLADAQRAKLDLICDKLGLRPGMRLLDVGCGWGSLVLHAARHHGVHATGVTLSREQAAFVRERAERNGLADRVTVRWQDYREIEGDPFDAVASVEMGEHVGADQYPTYTSVLHRMLRPRGKLLLQQMSRGTVAPGGGAFIESYITPDMTMTTLRATLAQLQQAGFQIRGVQAMREHYPRTIREWSAALERNADRLTAIAGVGQLRVWRLYLAGVALAFESDRMGVDQILAVRRP